MKLMKKIWYAITTTIWALWLWIRGYGIAEFALQDNISMFYAIVKREDFDHLKEQFGMDLEDKGINKDFLIDVLYLYVGGEFE